MTRDVAVVAVLLAAAAGAPAAPSPALRPVVRLVDARYRTGDDPSTATIPHVDVGGVLRFALVDGSFRVASIPLSWTPLPSAPDATWSVPVDVPEQLLQHCNSLFDVLLHVPLVVRAPGLVAPGTRVATSVGLVDVVPTVLDLLGLAPHATAQGRSLVPLLRAEKVPPRVLFAQIDDYWIPESLVAARTADLKLIVEPTRLEYAPFHYLADPGEERDVAAAVPADAARALLGEFTAVCGDAAPALPAGELPPATREQLRALGYVN